MSEQSGKSGKSVARTGCMGCLGLLLFVGLLNVFFGSSDMSSSEHKPDPIATAKEDNKLIQESVVLVPGQAQTYDFTAILGGKLDITIRSADEKTFDFVVLDQKHVDAYLAVPQRERPPDEVKRLHKRNAVTEVVLTDLRFSPGLWTIVILPGMEQESDVTVSVRMAVK